MYCVVIKRLKPEGGRPHAEGSNSCPCLHPRIHRRCPELQILNCVSAVCTPKEYGGLDVLNSMQMNKALILKWVWRIYQLDSSIWATIVSAKYTSNGDIFASSDRGGSQFSRSLHKIKHLFKAGAKHRVHNRVRTLFWLDWWHGDGPFATNSPPCSTFVSTPRYGLPWLLRKAVTFGGPLALPERKAEYDVLARISRAI